MKSLVIALFFISSLISKAQWTQCNNELNMGSVGELAIQGDYIFAATWQKLVVVSTDNGESWIEKSSGMDNIDVNCVTVNGNNVFAGTGGRGLFHSSDLGENWNAMNNWSTNPVMQYVYTIKILDNGIYIATSEGIFFTNDNGVTWTSKNSGLPASAMVKCILFYNNMLFAGTLSNSLYISSDNGDHWTQMVSLGTSSVNDLVVNGSDILAGTDEGLFISTNNGDEWNRLDAGIENVANVLTVFASGNFIMTGGGFGIHLTTDKGATWSIKNTGMNGVPVNDLAIKGEYIFAGCYNNGVYRAKLSDFGYSAVDESIKIENSAFALYPNPVSQFLNIDLNITNIIEKAEIYNLLGEKIMVIDIKNLSNPINVEFLPQGQYYLKIGSHIQAFVKM